MHEKVSRGSILPTRVQANEALAVLLSARLHDKQAVDRFGHQTTKQLGAAGVLAEANEFEESVSWIIFALVFTLAGEGTGTSSG